ncbi:hypothetical protein GWK47_001584 [Chionoecetes opilio]|uniref:Uncharacterized protein n=1 Tax=Chionoecetes opilio TaxID=41210 RepID=A0A8J4XXA4_CHIOP|nr:hypothetical protein GWK47_001584 [Chionoecetes opilio]
MGWHPNEGHGSTCPFNALQNTHTLVHYLLKNRVWTPKGFQSSSAVYIKICVPNTILDFPKAKEYGRELSLSGGNSIRQSIGMMGVRDHAMSIILPHQNTTPGPATLHDRPVTPHMCTVRLPERVAKYPLRPCFLKVVSPASPVVTLSTNVAPPLALICLTASAQLTWETCFEQGG